MSFFVDAASLKNVHVSMHGALACAFQYLIAAVNDPNCAVAQRALMQLEAIRPSALKVRARANTGCGRMRVQALVGCIEAQFDECRIDRPLLLHRLYTLLCLLPDMPLIGWDFFLARFDTLAVEAQLNMAQMSGDVQITQGTCVSLNRFEQLISTRKKCRHGNKCIRSSSSTHAPSVDGETHSDHKRERFSNVSNRTSLVRSRARHKVASHSAAPRCSPPSPNHHSTPLQICTTRIRWARRINVNYHVHVRS